MMITLRCRRLALVGIALLSSVVVAQKTVQEAIWNVPSGKAKDLSQTFQLGQLVPLSWNAYNGSICDLWLTTWDPNDPFYAYRISVKVDLRKNGGMNWRVPTLDHTIDMAKQTAKFVLRFKPPSESGVFKSNEPELSSPGFLLILGDLSTVTSASSTSTSSSSTLPTEAGAAATPAKTPTPTPTPTPSPTPEPQAAGISGAAIGGIAAGAVAGVAVASVLIWLLVFRARKRRAAAAASAFASAQNARYADTPSKGGELEGSSYYGSPMPQHKPYEAPGDYARHEAPGDLHPGGGGGGYQYQTWELDGSGRR